MKIAYLPQRQKRQNIILAILLIGLPLLVFAAYQVVKITSRAGTGAEPKNVVIGNISSNVISISWTTEADTLGYVIPVEGETKKSAISDSRSSGRLYTHYVELAELEPNTKYNFVIKSENKEYSTSDGKKLEFSTAPIVGALPSPGSLSGTLKEASGDDVLVYAFLSDKSTYPVSPLGGAVSKTGAWIIPFSDSRKISDSSYINITDSTNITLIALDGKGNTAKVEGAYNELFDKNGELKPTQDFSLSGVEDVYSLLPPESMLEVVIYEPEKPKPEPEEPEPEDPEPEPEEPEPGPEEPESVEEFERIYRIVHQLQWEELGDIQGNTTTTTFSGAKTIRVVDLTDSGFKVVWVSAEKEKGYINYGTSSSDLSIKAWDTRDSTLFGEMGEYYVHNVELDRLQKETKYYFEVVSGETTYDNNGSKYQESTLALIDPPTFKTIGVAADNLPDHGEAAFIAHIEDKDETGSSGSSKDISCIVSSSDDQCTIVISNSRIADGSAFYEYTDDDLLVIETSTTFESKKYSTKILGLEGSGVDFSIEKIPSSDKTTTTKVSALSSYGLTDSPSDVIKTDSSEIPKTGIMDSFWGILILSAILVVFVAVLYFFPRKREKNKMIKGI